MAIVTLSLHLHFEDGTQICVPSHEASFYIEKYVADGCALVEIRVCPGCPTSRRELDFNEVFTDTHLQHSFSPLA